MNNSRQWGYFINSERQKVFQRLILKAETTYSFAKYGYTLPCHKRRKATTAEESHWITKKRTPAAHSQISLLPLFGRGLSLWLEEITP